jgi:hypothetical protein
MAALAALPLLLWLWGWRQQHRGSSGSCQQGVWWGGLQVDTVADVCQFLMMRMHSTDVLTISSVLAHPRIPRGGALLLAYWQQRQPAASATRGVQGGCHSAPKRLLLLLLLLLGQHLPV